ncbi:TetR/AcrR family transcriptional regulator [Streptomyces sp. HNM0574]|uniref:TetR/AcrR family transcriptional regulator n=1 Tax=Streptomyces sp. HNM0574 TaxID=2714954 RepID=UPI00146AF9F6|nr:TetR/AcrR family transcriptional regulator [Streptomyces sp. HNM0574]NLU66184.1 TetR/AcrR family transcriptional regulator [Streptomyces sp. HNM0574]
MSTTPPVRNGRRGKPGRPGYDRDSLLEVAVAAFIERGYDSTGMEELSRRLGISKSSIYHHVSGKEELLDLALNRALDALFAILDEEPVPERERESTTALARLEHTVRRSVEVLAAELPYVTLLLRVHGNSDAEKRALARRRDFDHRVAALVRQAEEEGAVRHDIDPWLTSRLLFGTVNSLIEWYDPAKGVPVEHLSQSLTTILFDGLRARAR